MFCFRSSRRRETGIDCDWSSDVCSSDLAIVQPFFDGVEDRLDNCVITPNEDQLDKDDDEVGDACLQECGDGRVQGTEACDGDKIGRASSRERGSTARVHVKQLETEKRSR